MIIGAVIGAVLAPLLSTAAQAQTCPPLRDGLWSGQATVPPPAFSSFWEAQLIFHESNSTLSGTGRILLTEDLVPLSGTTNCNQIDFTSDGGSVFTGTLSPDGRAASGTLTSAVGPGIWNLNFVAPPPPAVSVDGASVQEGNSGTRSVEIPVTLSRPATSTVKVNYATSGLTALPDDYVPKSGTVTFTPGANGLTPVTKWINVKIRTDTVPEGDDAFAVTLSNPVGATVNDGGAAVYILDDDTTAGPVLTISSTSVYEGDEGKRDLRLTLWLSQPAAGPVEVEYSTGDGSAVAPADYRPKSDEITFAPGQVRKAITIKAVPDDVGEGAEQFYGYLLAAVGAPIDRDVAIFTIHDE